LPFSDTEAETTAASGDDDSSDDELPPLSFFQRRRLHQRSSSAEKMTEPWPLTPTKRDHRKKNEGRPASVKRGKQHGKQGKKPRPEGTVYQCPANVYLEWKRPTTSSATSGIRAHCRMFHPILELKPAKHACHLTGLGGKATQENACRLPGYAHVFAYVSDQG
jgi:hypothetical protein